MEKIVVDFETYSPESIDSGSVKYTMHKEADIICMAYKINDLPVLIWVPDGGRGCPEIFKNPDIVVYAHNALFDYLVWHNIGIGKYGFPELPLERWRDTMALANRYTLPNTLEKVGEVLGLDVQKDKRGKMLIKRICVPNKYGTRPRLNEDFTYVEYADFLHYAKTDVESTYALMNALPSDYLTSREQRYWELTQRMNLRGLPMDVECADKILGYIEYYAEEMMRQVPEITDGKVEKVTQVKQVVSWINTQGIKITNLQANTVEKLLEAELPGDVRRILELRQQLGRSSTAKYRKIKELEYDGRVYNNLQYHGANTGRWTGRGFQLQNLPRATVEDPLGCISAFNNGLTVSEPITVAKALIRSMIRAEEGYQLIVSDYKSIENRLLVWVAGDSRALNLFQHGKDQYIDMASYLYKKEPNDITKAERQIGKIVILGCGYGMGPKRFLEVAQQWGIPMTKEQAQIAIDAYREKYPEVRKLWHRLKACAQNAILNENKLYSYNDCTFGVKRDKTDRPWLRLKLPSGRNLYYMEPFIKESDYGPCPAHMGINPYKVWGEYLLTPARITENVIQGLARDVMAQGLLNIQDYMIDVTLIGTVHDEAIGEIYEKWLEPNTLWKFNTYLCRMPSWASGLPLEAEGYIAKRYKKV